MIAVAQAALAIVLADLEGIYGSLLINVLLTPFVVFCAARALCCWRFRVTASLNGVAVRPVLGREWRFSLSEIEKIERKVDRASAGTVRKLTILADARRVTMRSALAGIDELDAFLVSYKRERLRITTTK